MSAFCKASSTVLYNIVWSLAARQLAESVEALFTGGERLKSVHVLAN